MPTFQSEIIKCLRSVAFGLPPHPTSNRMPGIMSMSSSPTENRLLRALPGEAYAALARDLEAVRLRARQVLYEPADSIEHVYFPQSGVISLISTMRNGGTAEIALVGHEGVV